MSESSKNIWYQLGYALETARQHSPAPKKVRKKPGEADDAPAPSAVDQLLAAGGGAVTHRLISALSRRRPGTLRIARAALAGAGAAFVLSLLRMSANGSSAENAGEEGAVIVDETLSRSPGEGFDALTCKWVDLAEAGILDPTKVVRSALQNAASIAGLMLTTNTLVTSVKDEGEAVEGAVS